MDGLSDAECALVQLLRTRLGVAVVIDNECGSWYLRIADHETGHYQECCGVSFAGEWKNPRRVTGIG